MTHNLSSAMACILNLESEFNLNFEPVMIDTFWIGVYPGLTNVVPNYVCDQPSTLLHQPHYVVEKIEAFFGVNF